MIENEGKHFLFQIMIITNGSELGIALLFKIYFSDANVNLKKKPRWLISIGKANEKFPYVKNE